MTSTSNPAPATTYIYIPEQQNGTRSSHLARIRRTAIIQLIGGCLLVSLGIVAIILMARWSYFATAIWSGILIFGVTGVIGILAGNNGNKCLIRTYLVMSIFGCLMGFALFEIHIFAGIREGQGRWEYIHGGSRHAWQYWGCQPGDYFSWIPNCAKSETARVTFDALITTTGFFLFVTCIVSASFGCCAFKGCSKNCCCSGSGCSTPAPQPITAIFQPQGPTVATPGHQQVHVQAGMYIVQQGPAPVIQYPQVAMTMPATTKQGQAPYYVVPPATQAPPPPQLIPGHMHAQQPNPVAPPTYYVASQFPPVELPESKA